MGTPAAVGFTYGHWTVLAVACAPLKDSGHRYWLCRCSCGKERVVSERTLVKGASTKCRQCGSASTHGHLAGRKTSRTYNIWTLMRRRCLSPTDSERPHYADRGITVCASWLDFANFLADMGEAPDGMQLDRKDNDKGYTLDNCRWATTATQARNKRSTRLNEQAVKVIRHISGRTRLLAALHRVHPVTIRQARSGRYWKEG
jgi:hypothetical protein